MRLSRSTKSCVLLSLLVLFGAVWLCAALPVRLGLDLRGGTQFVLRTEDGERAKANAETTQETLEALSRRVDGLGVTEPQLVRSGERRIIVDLPGVLDPKEAADTLGRTAQLTFRPVLAQQPPGAPALRPAPGQSGQSVLPDETGRPLLLGRTAVGGDQVESAAAGVHDQTGRWQVSIAFDPRGATGWQRLTGTAACSPPGKATRRVAIVLDRKVISSPQVNQDVGCQTGITGGRTLISGDFSEQQAKELALLVRSGALPVPVVVEQQKTVGPALGAAAISASAWAAGLGLAATIAFVIGVYRLAGLVASVALLVYGVVSYAVLLGIGATLTLPGLAGFVLAVGMAVDANVLVFERAREEYAARPGAGVRAAARIGFDRAFSAIADSNVTTLLAAGLLIWLGSGAVRGFGVTLSIGVLVSMFTALVVGRVATELVLNLRAVQRAPRATGLAHQGRVRLAVERGGFDLMRRGGRFLAASVLVVAVAVSGLLVRGVNLGTEFTGGREVSYTLTRQLDVAEARRVVGAAGVRDATVTSTDIGSGTGLLVRAGTSFDDAAEKRIRAALARAAGGDGPGAAAGLQVERDDRIGPSFGDQLRQNALIALGVALAAQLAYLAIRFHWRWGVGAVLAMVHDVTVVLGVFAWLGRPLDGVFLAALLTVIGYSVNDSVVVFDRIRERVRDRRRGSASFRQLANEACLSTLPRTVNTGLGAVFVLAALLALGGDSLADFALALLVGVVVGTYSSVCTATPIAVWLEEHQGRRRRR